MSRVAAWLRPPLDDYLDALQAALGGRRAAGLVMVLVAAALCWWIYVPIHELLHAAGCALGGGTVTRLEIDAVYGASLLQRWFPFVAVGSDYAGQLTGFDTHGNDLTYLLTDALPFSLTILVGVPLLRWAARRQGRPLGAAAALGAALPIAFAPFISLTGDYYEMGSIVVSRLVHTVDAGLPLERWRSDDLFALVGHLRQGPAGMSAADVLGVTAGLLLGIVLAFATYALGSAVAHFFERWRSFKGSFKEGWG